MGAVISPLWCNIYLHQLDAYLVNGVSNLVRYADDFVILCASEEEAHAAREETAERSLAAIAMRLPRARPA